MLNGDLNFVNRSNAVEAIRWLLRRITLRRLWLDRITPEDTVTIFAEVCFLKFCWVFQNKHWRARVESTAKKGLEVGADTNPVVMETKEHRQLYSEPGHG